MVGQARTGMARRKSQYSLYYSGEADPMETMLRANTLRSKSSYNINQQWPAVAHNPKQFGSR